MKILFNARRLARRTLLYSGLFFKAAEEAAPGKIFTSIGGQAVIEGVMMRSPKYIAVAVRGAERKILIRTRKYEGWSAKYPVLKKPVLRGVVTLVESMIQGIHALSFSAEKAALNEMEKDSKAGPAGKQAGKQDAKSEEALSSMAIATSMIFAFVMAMGLFVALPHGLAAILTSERFLNFSADSPQFHLIDGVFKMAILLAYVFLIGLMKDIHRVFQYHGAEHKSIYAFESGKDLNVENARKFTTLHPRCGTSFLLFLVLISVAVFSIVFPIFGLTSWTSIVWLNHVIMVLVKIVLMLPVSGLAYEFIKASASRLDNPVFRALIWPGLMLQNLTTRKPDDDQLEVALASLRQVLFCEKTPPIFDADGYFDLEILAPENIASAPASVREFAEAH